MKVWIVITDLTEISENTNKYCVYGLQDPELKMGGVGDGTLNLKIHTLIQFTRYRLLSILFRTGLKELR